jgi:hypothetical protein
VRVATPLHQQFRIGATLAFKSRTIIENKEGPVRDLTAARQLLGRESARKVRLRLALTLKELGLNLMNQYCAAPAVLNGGVSVPFALGTGSHTQNLNIVVVFPLLVEKRNFVDDYYP